jgi:hypothetical protein
MYKAITTCNDLSETENCSSDRKTLQLKKIRCKYYLKPVEYEINYDIKPKRNSSVEILIQVIENTCQVTDI